MAFDQHISSISLVSSLLLHLLFFVFFHPESTATLLPQTNIPIPVSLSIKEIIIPASPKKQTVSPIRKRSLPIAVPQSLPGDTPHVIVTHNPEPYYPKDAIHFNLEGAVSVIASINSHGVLTHVALHKSSGHDILDTAFIMTVKQYYRFKPKRVMGVNQSDRISLTYHFAL